MKPTLFLLLLTSLSFAQTEAEKKKEEPAPKETPAKVSAKDPVTREDVVTIGGKRIPYRATTGKLQLKKDDGTPRASIFHVTYERTDVKDAAARPVVFCFNGGPGSSAVWLHLGGIGPRRVELPGDGTAAPVPPVKVIGNEFSILDVADLVFIDPVTTGYSRAEKDTKDKEFHGVDEDVQSVGDFIRRWITEHGRWASPKYLLGESYGGVRAAGLSEHLQSRYGMSLNGVIMLSTLLDFRTIRSSQGDDLSYSVFLPAFTGTAHHHGKISGDRDQLIAESSRFAFDEYAAALLKGTALDEGAAKAIAEKLASLTGIPAKVWSDKKLRISPSGFRSELLRAERKIVGRFDARVAWDGADITAAWADQDPSYSLAYGAFSTGMLAYLGNDLGWKEDQPYEILTSKVQPWRWGADNEVLNLSGKLVDAIRDNPHLRVLVMCGRTDLATPPEGMAYSVRQMLDLPEPLRKNFSFTHYDAGHMFYLNPPDLVKCRADLVKFLESR
ncbi:MAG: peptidase S10 [Akkermansiaceae bacterium]|nr:peptidase S10 [Akkermansiaceae bacterium]